MADVARHAGVSCATVSRALNHPDLVNEDTYLKIQKAVEALNYIVSKPAETKKEDATVGQAEGSRLLIVVNIATRGYSFQGDVLQGIRERAAKYNWNVLLNEDSITRESLDSFRMLLSSCNAAGLILTTCCEPDVIEVLARDLPIVQCGEVSHQDYPSVSVDHYLAAKKAVNYLISTGRKRIALLSHSEILCEENWGKTILSSHVRAQGYVDAIRESGLEHDPSLVIRVPEMYFAYAYSAMKAFLQRGNHLDAVFAVVDVMAYAAVVALQDCGLRVPEDVAVMGYDNVEISEMSRPKITTVSIQRKEMGMLSCDMLYGSILHPESTPQSMTLDAELIVREST